jgi:hypothetical protein
MANGMCSKCGKPLDGKHKSYCNLCLAEYYRNRRSENKVEYNRYQREQRSRVPVEKRRLNRRRYGLKAYGLTVDEYQSMLVKQEGNCAICGDSLSDSLDSLGRGNHVDHCHETGIVRGILCSRCNLGLGHFRNDPHILESAIRYLASTMEVR